MSHTQQQIDEEYTSMLKEFESRLVSKKKYTECEKVEMVMRDNPHKIWWYPYELIGWFDVGEEVFIGYKAPARLYDLEQKGIVEGRELGKYKVWRLL